MAANNVPVLPARTILLSTSEQGRRMTNKVHFRVKINESDTLMMRPPDTGPGRLPTRQPASVIKGGPLKRLFNYYN